MELRSNIAATDEASVCAFKKELKEERTQSKKVKENLRQLVIEGII